MENRTKILLALGAVAAAWFGKKHLDKRRGSGAIWAIPQAGSGQKVTAPHAFLAWNQRNSELAPWEVEADKSLARNGFINKYAGAGSYTDARFGETSDNQKEWNEWYTTNKDDYRRMEAIMGTRIAGKFDPSLDDNANVMAGEGRLKDGYTPMDPQGKFDGASTSSSDPMSGKGTFKHDPMTPQGKWSRGSGRDYDPFSPFRRPKIG